MAILTVISLGTGVAVFMLGMLLMKYVETLKEIGAGNQAKTVFLPFEASNLVGALGSLTELIDKKK